MRASDPFGGTFDATFNVITGSTAANNPLPANGDINTILFGDDILYGVSGNDVIYGGVADDTLFGQDGNDTLHGGSNDDWLYGGAGNDTFVFTNLSGQDVIADFTAGGTDDVINLSAVTNPDWTSFANVQANLTQVGANAVIDLGNGNTITLVGVTAGNLTAGDFVL